MEQEAKKTFLFSRVKRLVQSVKPLSWNNSRLESNSSALNSSSLYVSNQDQVKDGECLLLVDPQVDFVTGSLAVDGASEDCERIANFIKRNTKKLDEIYVTLDTHMNYHIAHPMFWKVGNTEQHPTPFTQITLKEIEEGKYCPVNEKMKDWVKIYAETLQNTNRLPGLESFVLTIWPPHCLIGTPGHCVEPKILAALQLWEQEKKSAVHYIFKGNNSKTEHYSAFRAEVLVPEDKATNFNFKLLSNLKNHSRIYVGGEAKSHCVNFTVRDLVGALGVQTSNDKVVLLKGGMSSVTGFEPQGEKFWNDMTTNINGLNLTVESIRTTV